MTVVDTTNPYLAAADTYLTAGWAPIPLPPRAKTPPPDGVTGYRGRYPTKADVAQWKGNYAAGNIAIRLPPDIVGVDIDVYSGGHDGLTHLEQQYGPLPSTVTSTSRTDGSGIRLYRVPNGTTLKTDPATGVDMVQFFHRYVVAAPSIHPDTGHTYRWHQDGEPLDVDELPEPEDLPQLPWEWIEGLAADKNAGAERAATPTEVLDFLARHTGAARPQALAGVRTALADANAKRAGRHDTVMTVACWAMREAAAGYYPAAAALDVLEQWWDHTMDNPARSRARSGEFGRIISWAIAVTTNDPDRVTDLANRPPPASGLGEWIEPATSTTAAPAVSAPDTPPATLTVRWADTLDTDMPPEPPELVAGFLRQGALTVLGAPRAVGKTWLGYNLATLLARGEGNFLGHLPVRRAARVLYLQGELDEWGSAIRWKSLAGLQPLPNVAESFDRLRIRIHTRRTTGVDTHGRLIVDEHLEATIDDQLEATIDEHDVDVVVIDPWAVYFAGKENDNDQVEAGLARLREIMLRRGTTFVILHHLGKDRTAGEPEDLWRGATRLADWASTRVTVLPHYTEARRKDLGLARKDARRFVDVHFLQRGEPTDDFSMHLRHDGWWEAWTDPATDQPDQAKPGRRPKVTMADVGKVLRTAGGSVDSVTQLAELLDVNRRAAQTAVDSAITAGLITLEDGTHGARRIVLNDTTNSPWTAGLIATGSVVNDPNRPARRPARNPDPRETFRAGAQDESVPDQPERTVPRETSSCDTGHFARDESVSDQDIRPARNTPSLREGATAQVARPTEEAGAHDAATPATNEEDPLW